MKEIKAQYQEFLDNIVQKYKGRTFCYNPPVSSEDADLTLVGRNGLRLEFQDARGNFNYLSIEDFLQLAQTSTKCTESSAGQVLAHERFKHNVSKGYDKL